MNFVVKNTTKIQLLDLICPHICRGCGKLGEVLCECCKNDILQSQRAICPLCKCIVAEKYESVRKCCSNCKTDFKEIWVGGWREAALAKLVVDYKYRSVRACGEILVEILDQAIPKDVFIGENVVLIPLPTIGRHVRERGFDHTWKIGKKLARRRSWKCQRILGRASDTVQVGAQASDRQIQAAKAYMLNGVVDEQKVYVLLDDVWTTGASMLAVAQILKSNGARRIYGAVVAVSKDKKYGN